MNGKTIRWTRSSRTQPHLIEADVMTKCLAVVEVSLRLKIHSWKILFVDITRCVSFFFLFTDFVLFYLIICLSCQSILLIVFSRLNLINLIIQYICFRVCLSYNFFTLSSNLLLLWKINYIYCRDDKLNGRD